MYLTIEHNSGVPISAQVIDQVKYRVVSGALAPGERIPSVRALARQLKLNPTTVARTYRQLEADGIIFTQRGSGTFIAKGQTGFTLSEKRKQVSRRVRELVVEAGRIGLDFQELLKLVERDISKIRHKERKP